MIEDLAGCWASVAASVAESVHDVHVHGPHGWKKEIVRIVQCVHGANEIVHGANEIVHVGNDHEAPVSAYTGSPAVGSAVQCRCLGPSLPDSATPP